MRRPRLAALLAVAALAAAACGDDDEPRAEDASGTTAPAAPGTTGAGAGAETTTIVPSDDGGGAPGGPGGSPGGAPPSTSPAPAPIRTDGGPGSLAAFFLRASASQRLVVEVHAQSGASPRQATVDHLASVLRAVSNKAVSVESRGVPGGAQAWSRSSLDAAREAGGHRAQSRDAAVFRLLFLHGTFGNDDSVLGVAYRGDTAAVFVDQVGAAGGLLTGSGPLEDAVTMHEAGHLLGLVDLVVDTGRDDPGHPGHSTNRGSVMYWAVESSLVNDVLTGGPPRDFDAADRADLARIRTS